MKFSKHQQEFITLAEEYWKSSSKPFTLISLEIFGSKTFRKSTVYSLCRKGILSSFVREIRLRNKTLKVELFFFPTIYDIAKQKLLTESKATHH